MGRLPYSVLQKTDSVQTKQENAQPEPSGGKNYESYVNNVENNVEVADVLQHRSGVNAPISCEGYLLGTQGQSFGLDCTFLRVVSLHCTRHDVLGRDQTKPFVASGTDN